MLLLRVLRTEGSGVAAWMWRVLGTTTVTAKRFSHTGSEKRFGRMSQTWLEEHVVEAAKHDLN